MIKIYPSFLPGEPLETHEYSGTVAGWFDSEGLAWRERSSQPVCVIVNGEQVYPSDWETFRFGRADNVEIRVNPRGGIISGLGNLLSGIFNFAFGWLFPGQGGPSSYRTPSGQSLDAADAKANQAKLGSVVPELCGRWRRYPEYLTAPCRYFVSPREQWLDIFVNIGPGEYEIDPNDVMVGDTPLNSLGDDAEFVIFPPGADVSTHTAHENWYIVSEIGPTSAGTAGLELSADPSSDVNPPSGEYMFNNDEISLDPSDGIFPESWGPGTALTSITVPRSYSITSEFDPINESFYNHFTGNFREVGISSMMEVSVSGAGLANPPYYVNDFDIDGNGDGWVQLEDQFGTIITGITPGTYTMTFKKPGRTYRVVSRSDNTVEIQAILSGSVEAGWPGFPETTTTSSSITVNPNTVYGEPTGPFTLCPVSRTSDNYEIDVFFSQGLCYINDSGGLENRSVRVDIQYREVGAPTWSSTIKTYTAHTVDQVGYTESFSLPPGRYEFRLRRVGARNTSTQVKDVVEWYGARCELPAKTVYENWTTMAIRLRGSNKISARSENQINVIATRVLPTLQPDGSWGAPTATRDISAFVRHVAQTIGYSDADIDMDELLRLHNIWTSRNEYADTVFDETTVREALGEVLQAGMSELTIDGGRLRPVRDEPRTVFEQSYSPFNMKDGLTRSFTSIRPDDADGVEVEYQSAETWEKAVIQCLLPGDQGFKVEKLKLSTVTDETQAWRIGMRRRRMLRYRRWEYAFQTDMGGLNSRYLSYVGLFEDTPGYGQAALLTNIEASSSGALLTVSEKVIWHIGENHVVAYRDDAGRLIGPFPATPGPDDYSIIADIPLPWPVITLKQELPHVYIGTTERWTFPALVTEIRPSGLYGDVSISATNYDDRVYADDDNTPD